MADSIRELITLAAVAQLGAVGKPASLTIHRTRTLAIPDDQLPATVLYVVKELVATVHGRTGVVVARQLVLRLEHRAAGDPLDRSLDPLTTWAVQALFADPTLGGLAKNLEEVGLEWIAPPGQLDKALGAVAHDFLVTYSTLRTDPTRRS